MFVFDPMWVYMIAIAVAFFTAFFIILITDYRTPEEKADALARAAAARNADEAEEAELVEDEVTATDDPAKLTSESNADATVLAPVAGEVVAMEALSDAAFASGALGQAVGVTPENTTLTVVAPAAGKVISVAKTGHAYGIKTDDGVELLVHIGVDTVKLGGEGFTPLAEKKQMVNAGDPLAEVDFAAIAGHGVDTTVITAVVNSKKLGGVGDVADGTVVAGDPILEVTTEVNTNV